MQPVGAAAALPPFVVPGVIDKCPRCPGGPYSVIKAVVTSRRCLNWRELRQR